MTSSPSNHDTSHGACGKTWRQRGNRTGHCSACHETFEGLSLFDAHRVSYDDGSRGCLDPAEMTFSGQTPTLENGSWRGPKMPDSVKAKYAKESNDAA